MLNSVADSIATQSAEIFKQLDKSRAGDGGTAASEQGALMARLFKQGEAKDLGLPGRKAREIVSGERGARGVTLRIVEIPVAKTGDTLRAAHHHSEFEECIYTLSGQGTTFADSANMR